MSVSFCYLAKTVLLDMSLVWRPEELPASCSITTFASSPGSDCGWSRKLPIEQDAEEILQSISEKSVVAIKAETGSGKTMKGPAYLLEVVDPLPVLIVQKSCFAAESVFTSLKTAFSWPEERLHLKTGVHDAEAPFHRWTQFSVITYGMLWEWFSS